LRSLVCTSGGSSGSLSGFSSASAGCSPSFLSSSFSVGVSEVCAFSFGRGVPARLGSSSSPMTNSGSNSDGSGPLPAGAALSPSLPLDGRFEGDRFRELDLRGAELDLEGVDWPAFCRACSSAIRASMAPRMRCEIPCQPHCQVSWAVENVPEALETCW
jgi:hypothetical protein